MATAYNTSKIILPQGAGYKSSTLYAWNPQQKQTVDFDVVRNTTATRVNPSGLIESVAANVPRIDYTNGGCGELLVEPQRTNTALRSSEFDNAYWSLGAATITANATTSPDGAVTADLLTATGSGGVVLRSNLWDTNQQTASVFVKNDNCTNFRVEDASAGNGVSFNIVSGTVISEDAGFSGSVDDYGNGWFRVKVTYTSPASRTLGFKIPTSGESAFIWGAQLEQGSYPTSYIPTSGSAVTRNADVISLTNASALLGDSEGVMFVEGSFTDSDGIILSLSDGSINNRAYIRRDTSTGAVGLRVAVAGANEGVADGTSLALNTNAKIAIKYAPNNFAVWLDGVETATDNSGSTYGDGVLTRLGFDAGNGAAPFHGRIRQIAIFDQALTDAELASITS